MVKLLIDDFVGDNILLIISLKIMLTGDKSLFCKSKA